MKLLVVEDEPKLPRGLRASLRRAGYAVDVTADGEISVEREPGRGSSFAVELPPS